MFGSSLLMMYESPVAAVTVAKARGLKATTLDLFPPSVGGQKSETKVSAETCSP